MASAKERAVEVFRSVDTDGFGTVPRAIFEHVMRAVCHSSPDSLEALEALESGLVRMEGGAVRYDEFFEWLYSDSDSSGPNFSGGLEAALEDAVIPQEPVRSEAPAASAEAAEATAHEDWIRFKGERLDKALRVDPEHGDSPMRLVDARFLLNLAGYQQENDGGIWAKRRECQAMRRRQELPAEAFVALGELRQLRVVHLRALPVLAVSYPWLQPDHPDPRCDSLSILAFALAALINYLGRLTLGIFLDFMSLHQKSPDGTRTSAEQSLFGSALGMLSEIYSHEHTFVFKISTLPRGYPDGFTFPAECTPNQAEYYDRGWCFCESSVASLTNNNAFDLGKLSGADLCSEVPDMDDIWEKCRAGRSAPALPEDFELALQSKCFTSKKADCPQVAAIYAEAFQARFAEATELHYSLLLWGDAEAEAVARVLGSGATPLLERLFLNANQIGTAGAEALAGAIRSGRVPKLCEVRFFGNPGDAGALKEAALANNPTCTFRE